MIKGSERKIIVLEKLDDPYFEKAYFFVRCGVGNHVCKKTLSCAAEEILSSLENYGEPPSFHGSSGIAVSYPKKTKAKVRAGRLGGLHVLLICGCITFLIAVILFLLL